MFRLAACSNVPILRVFDDALVRTGADEPLQLLIDDHLDGRAHCLTAPCGEVVFEVGLRRNHEVGSVSLEGSFGGRSVYPTIPIVF